MVLVTERRDRKINNVKQRLLERVNNLTLKNQNRTLQKTFEIPSSLDEVASSIRDTESNATKGKFE
ncbi:MAG: hypothetical protein J0H85_03770 [Sediminibacterium magnilacihabitans]|jgi:hypothetical protein|nr:hypothetical protein [Sediminibacterium magnilacihabitans]PQV61988.1 hypothetical protein CLV53_101263 [Sediminibacterium magnilacihabitans]